MKSTIVAVLVLIALGTVSGKRSASLIGTGSSVAKDLVQKWAEQIKTASYSQVTAEYKDADTGPDGLALFLNGSAHFAVFDKAQSAQIAELNYTGTILHLPITIAGLTITYNLERTNITGKLNLTADILARVYQQNITTWNDPDIVALNPNLNYDGDIFPVRRADSSGTTYVFTEYLSSASKRWTLGTSALPNWPKGTLIGIGNDGVLEVVKAAVGSIGYVAFGTAVDAGLKRAFVQNRAGNWVTPDTNTIMGAVDTGSVGLPAGNDSWTHVSMVDEPGADSWPLVTFIYVVVKGNVTDLGTSTGPALVAWLTWLMRESAQDTSQGSHFVPLPQSVIQINQKTISTISYDNTLYTSDEFLTKEEIDTGNTPGVWAAIGILSGLGIAFWLGWEFFGPKPAGGHGHGHGAPKPLTGSAIVSGGHKV